LLFTIYGFLSPLCYESEQSSSPDLRFTDLRFLFYDCKDTVKKRNLQEKRFAIIRKRKIATNQRLRSSQKFAEAGEKGRKQGKSGVVS
jgi:hypothetical protein